VCRGCRIGRKVAVFRFGVISRARRRGTVIYHFCGAVLKGNWPNRLGCWATTIPANLAFGEQDPRSTKDDIFLKTLVIAIEDKSSHHRQWVNRESIRNIREWGLRKGKLLYGEGGELHQERNLQLLQLQIECQATSSQYRQQHQACGDNALPEQETPWRRGLGRTSQLGLALFAQYS